jgi:hypothetical protein
MSKQPALPETAPRKSAGIKLFGVAFIFVGVLDSMLSWRGGFRMDGAYALLIGFGFFLYALGAIRGGDRSNGIDSGQRRGAPRASRMDRVAGRTSGSPAWSSPRWWARERVPDGPASRERGEIS